MRRISILLTAMTISASMSAQKITYPKTMKDGTVDDYFGVKVADPYRWLENEQGYFRLPEQDSPACQAEGKTEDSG